MSAVRVGVIGCGYWGPNLIRNFVNEPQTEAVAIADLDEGRLNRVGRQYPSVQTTTDVEGLLTRDDIDAVAIATPVSTHHELAKAALEQGKHVLLEKPMTASVAEADDLIDVAEQRERILMVDHTFLYTGAVRKVRELVDQGELGELFYLDSIRINLGLFQHDVNVLWDLAPHDFSIMDYWIGGAPQKVSAMGASPVPYPDKKLESIAYVTVDFGDDVIAHFHVSWLSPLKTRRMLLGGSRKMVVYDHLDVDNQVKVYDKGVEIQSAEERRQYMIQRRMGDMHAPKVDQTEALGLVAQHFAECIQTDQQPLTDGRAGRRVVQLLEASQRSMANGGAVEML